MSDNQSQRVRYRKKYVAFLDVLGFENLVRKSVSDSAAKGMIAEYFSIVGSSIREIREIPGKRNIDSIVISDSIILAMDQAGNIDEDIDKLRHFCVAVGLIQYKLALKGYWLRGAISSGEIHFDRTNRQIVGPAYIEAFRLENNRAVYPRVILQSSTPQWEHCSVNPERCSIIC